MGKRELPFALLSSLRHPRVRRDSCLSNPAGSLTQNAHDQGGRVAREASKRFGRAFGERYADEASTAGSGGGSALQPISDGAIDAERHIANPHAILCEGWHFPATTNPPENCGLTLAEQRISLPRVAPLASNVCGYLPRVARARLPSVGAVKNEEPAANSLRRHAQI